MHLILDTNGAHIDREDGRFKITSEKHERLIAPGRINSISILKNATLSTAAALLAAESDIPLVIFNRQGKPAARLWSSYYGSISTLRRKQVLFEGTTACMQWLFDSLALKMEGQCRNLHNLAALKPSAATGLKQAAVLIKNVQETRKPPDAGDAGKAALMNLDAVASKYYWEALSLALQNVMPFERRSRQPAEDPFNAVINYLYGMLYSVVEGAVLTAGLDPQLGFLHADEYNQPTFVFDCIEPFRPWTDWLALELAVQKRLPADCFETVEARGEKDLPGCWLSRNGKKILIPAFFEHLKAATLFNGKRIKREDQIRFFCSLLVQQLKSFNS